MKRTIAYVVALCAILVAGVAIVAVFSRGARTSAGDNNKDGAEPRHVRAPSPSVRPSKTLSATKRPKPKPIISVEDDDDDKRTPEEKALAERIEKALDDEDFELAVACAEEAQKCGDAEIRQSMVDTLGWFGEKALPELTPFLADADEDVRDSAMSEWTTALSSIEDEGVKIRTVELAMGVLNDEDALEEISNEYIGADEKLAVESLARIIEGGGSKEGVEKAKETYEFVTGDEWTDAAEAERWIAEEYEPPEES